MEPAVFSLVKYNFDKVLLDFSNVKSDSLDLSITPKGKFNEKDKTFLLIFDFCAKDNISQGNVISLSCFAEFSFKNVDKLDDIPQYFYSNSIAIIFPYVRAFISTLTLQANKSPIVLPTMNLSSLQEELKKNTMNE